MRWKPFPAWPVWGSEEEELLLAALRSGRWGIGGELTERFASSFAAYQGCRYGVACANGTVALKIALRAVGVGEGDRVVIPPYTFIATASVVIELGAIPIFADIEPSTLNIDPSEIEERLGDVPKAVVPVHIAGCPADMDAISKIARGNDIRVVEDAAQAHGSEWRGRRTGGLGDAGCFSFQSSKIMTSGEGGAIVTNNEELSETCWSLMNCGRTRSGDWYEHELLGYNYRMTEFQAAVLMAQLRRLDEQIALRARNYSILVSLLGELEGFEPLRPPEGVTRHNHYQVPLRIDRVVFGDRDKRRIVEAIRAEGIPCSPGYTLPLYRYRPVREYMEKKGVGVDLGGFPNTEDACRDILWLPHSLLLGGEDDMRDIYEALRKVEKNVGEL